MFISNETDSDISWFRGFSPFWTTVYEGYGTAIRTEIRKIQANKQGNYDATIWIH